jgi:hypothetical protein
MHDMDSPEEPVSPEEQGSPEEVGFSINNSPSSPRHRPSTRSRAATKIRHDPSLIVKKRTKSVKVMFKEELSGADYVKMWHQN